MVTLNKILLETPSALVNEIITEGGIKFYIDPTYNPEYNASVIGKVFALPESMSDRLAVGDEVLFSYRVCSDTGFGVVGDYFMPAIEDNPICKKFINSKGDRLSVVAMPPVFGKFNTFYVGVLTDKYGAHIDGTQGNESQVERWMSQFTFSGVQDMKFNNLFEIDGKPYWKADATDIFAKYVDGEFVSIGDRVIMEPIEIDMKTQVELIEGVTLPYQSVKARLMDRATVVSGGEDIGIKKGDVVSFNELYLEKYELFGKKIFLIKKKRIQGIWNEYSTIL